MSKDTAKDRPTQSKHSKIQPAMNIHTVADVIATIIKDYGQVDLHISDVITKFYERLQYDYPAITRQEFVDMINEVNKDE